MECMKSEKKIERFLILLELQEMAIPVMYVSRKFFMRKIISTIRENLSGNPSNKVNVSILQRDISSYISSRVMEGKMKAWESEWATGVTKYLKYL